MYRFYLVINGVTSQIQMPNGWADTSSKIERQKTHGFIQSYGDLNLTFYCAGSELPGGYNEILTEYKLKGADAEIIVYETNDCTGVEIQGKRASLDLYEMEYGEGEEGTYLSVPAQTTTIQKVVNSRIKNKVDLFKQTVVDGITVPALTPQTAVYRSKAILYEFYGLPPVTSMVYDIDYTRPGANNNEPLFIQHDFGGGSAYDAEGEVTNKVVNELPGFVNYSTQINLVHPVEVKKYSVKVPIEAPGKFTIDLKIDHVLTGTAFDGMVLQADDIEDINYVQYYWVITAKGVEYYSNVLEDYPNINLVSYNPEFNVSVTVDLVPGDEIYISGYIRVGVDNNADVRYLFKINDVTSYLNIFNASLIPNETESGLLAHEALNQTLYGITGIPNILYSDYYGRTDSNRVYPANGCGALNFITSGRLLRELDENKTFQISFEELFLNGLLPIHNIGYNLEYEGALQRYRVEPMEYFYNDYEIIKFFNLDDYREEVAQDIIYSKIETGYEDEAPDDINTVDEFNTKREYVTPVKKNEQVFSQTSKLVAGGYATEFTRRKKDKTSAYKYDNKNFITAVRKNGITYETERGEPFDTVTGVFSPETIVNARITPARNLIRFTTQINAAVYRKGEAEQLTYTYGEGNTLLTTDLKVSESCTDGDLGAVLSENSSFLISQLLLKGLIYVPEYIYFTCNVLQSEYDLIISHIFPAVNADNMQKYGYISVDKDGEIVSGYLQEIEYNSVEGTASFKLIKRYAE